MGGGNNTLLDRITEVATYFSCVSHAKPCHLQLQSAPLFVIWRGCRQHEKRARGRPRVTWLKQCSAQVFKRAGCHLKRAHLVP